MLRYAMPRHSDAAAIIIPAPHTPSFRRRPESRACSQAATAACGRDWPEVQRIGRLEVRALRQCRIDAFHHRIVELVHHIQRAEVILKLRA